MIVTVNFDRNNTYTGKLKYKDIDFTFVFADAELRLIPPADQVSVIEWQWKMKSIGYSAYTNADPIPVDEKYIIAKCNETNRRLIFLPKEGSYLSFYNSVVIIDIISFVVCRYDKDLFDRVTFSCPEINHIHPTNQAFSFSLTEDFSSKGTVEINTHGFGDTTTDRQSFQVDDKKVDMYFGISRTVSNKIDEPPLSVNSCLFFEFDAINDYSFIFRLWRIAVDFIRFLCYRRNIYIGEIELAAPCQNGNHEPFATMFIISQTGETEEERIKQGRYIKQAHIAGKEGIILSDIASESIYLRHLPETYFSGRHIDAARFVMITAAFEWEFKRLYPDGVKKSDTTINAENEVSEEIQNLIETTKGKKKKIYKKLHRLVRSDSLQSEIIQIGKDFSSIIDIFGNNLYRINGQVLKYCEMGQRLSDQRNHFAHGDLDKDFIGLSLLDLMFMEYIIYAMQLKYYDINENEIQKSINELFCCRLAL